MNDTDFINLTELWQDGKYTKVGDALRPLGARQVSEFCAYFSKYVGVGQLQILHKFI